MGLSISQSRCSVAFTAHTALARHGFQRHGFGEAHVDDLAGRRGVWMQAPKQGTRSRLATLPSTVSRGTTKLGSRVRMPVANSTRAW